MSLQPLSSDPFNIIVTGVGGQGNVMASRILAKMLTLKGYDITIGETFGASQRGGSVMSHIRISQKGYWSPQIPKGKVHLIISLEPIEAIRALFNYGNESVYVISNDHPIHPARVIAGESDYPDISEIREALAGLTFRFHLIDATTEAVRLNNSILSNIIMIGAASGLNLIPLGTEEFDHAIREFVPETKIKSNIEAFNIGRRKIYELNGLKPN